MAIELNNDFVPVISAVRSGTRILILSDFDGTLIPHQDDPSQCRLPEEIRKLLGDLNLIRQVTTGIVSGRSLDDLRHVTGVIGMILAGNHGFEIEGPGFSFQEPTAASQTTKLSELLEGLAPQLSHFPGVWVESKALTATIHLRRAASRDWLAVADLLYDSVRQSHDFFVRYDCRALEIRPRIDWHKGKAVEWLRHRLHKNGSDAQLVYFGDSTTDEDVFAMFRDQITIKVGNDVSTKANYSLANVSRVHALLATLLTLLRG
jgi:trehalose 6-phosphate phosphatase